MFDPKILAGRSILVTGGGSGLGLAMAKTFAAHGAQVTIAGRRREKLEAAAVEIAAAAREGGEAAFLDADIRDPEAAQKLVAFAVSRFGKLDGLVNNAAGNFLAFSEELTPNGFDAVVRTVLYGSVNCTLAVGRHLLERKAPGADRLDRDDLRLDRHGLRAALGVRQGGSSRDDALARRRVGLRRHPPERHRARARSRRRAPSRASSRTSRPRRPRSGRIPLARFGRSEEIANLATFLLSDLCPYQTGDCVTMDGGEWLAGAGEFSDYRKVPRAMLKAGFDAMKPRKG